MSAVTETVVIVLKTLILLLGTGVTALAYRAYRRTGDPSLRALSLGFGSITLGALLGGVAHQVLGVTLEQGVVVNSALVALGLATVTYSLYME